jgi:hypothetical protein
MGIFSAAAFVCAYAVLAPAPSMTTRVLHATARRVGVRLCIEVLRCK